MKLGGMLEDTEKMTYSWMYIISDHQIDIKWKINYMKNQLTNTRLRKIYTLLSEQNKKERTMKIILMIKLMSLIKVFPE